MGDKDPVLCPAQLSTALRLGPLQPGWKRAQSTWRPSFHRPRAGREAPSARLWLAWPWTC